MPDSSSPTMLVMHSLRLKGFAEVAAIAEVTALTEDVVASVISGLQVEGLTTRREGRICGWSLSPAGRSRHLELLRDANGPRDALEHAYKRFLDANDEFKLLCTDWQLRTVGGEQALNDHTDAAYDAAIIERLAALHADIVPVLDDLAAAVSRFGTYPRRLGSALTRLQGGDQTALARPLSESFHDVWMELHEDLLLSLGKERSMADGH